MLRTRSFAAANVAALLFSVAFGAMLLAAVLWTTGVWEQSILAAGLSIAPGPLTAAAFAPPAGRAAARLGQRTLAGAGCALFALGCLWWLWRLDPAPDYAGALLPGMLLTGAGVGMTLPSLASAAAASLPPARFATGSAVLTMSRQLGVVLGVAVLVAVLGDGADFDAVWAFMAGAAALASAAALSIGVVEPPVATAPVAA